MSQNGKVLNWNKINGVKEYIIYIFNSKNENVKYIQNICYLDSINKNKTQMELKNETDPTYIGIYTTTNNSFNVKEEGIYYITVVANLENSYPLKYAFNEIKYDSSLPPTPDEPSSHTLAIVLGVCIPLVIIITIIIVVILVKRKRNQDIERNMPQDDNDSNQALVRPTTSTMG